jgi:hypothetical protein
MLQETLCFFVLDLDHVEPMMLFNNLCDLCYVACL